MVTLKVCGKEYAVTDDQFDSLERQLDVGITKAFQLTPEELAERDRRIAAGEHFDPIGTSQSILEQLQERHCKIAEEKAAGTYVEPDMDPDPNPYQPDSWGTTLFIEGSNDFTTDYEFYRAFHEFRQLMLRRNIQFHIRTQLPSGKIVDRTSEDFRVSDEET